MLGRWHADHSRSELRPHSYRTLVVRVPSWTNPTSNTPPHAITFVQVDDRSAAAIVSTVTAALRLDVIQFLAPRTCLTAWRYTRTGSTPASKRAVMIYSLGTHSSAPCWIAYDG